MPRFLLLVLALFVVLAAAQAAQTPRLRKLQEESNAGQGEEDGVDVDKSVKQGWERMLGKDDKNDHDDHTGHDHRALGPKDDDHADHPGHEDHTGHSHRILGKDDKDDHDDHTGHDHMLVAAEQEGDKQPADPRAGLCKMPGQSPCPNGPGTCTLLFCDCQGMQNCRYIDPPQRR